MRYGAWFLVSALAALAVACAGDTTAPDSPPPPPPLDLTGTWQYAGEGEGVFAPDCHVLAQLNLVHSGSTLGGSFSGGSIICLGTDDRPLPVFETGMAGALLGGLVQAGTVTFTFPDFFESQDWPSDGMVVDPDSLEGTFSGNARTRDGFNTTISGTWAASRDP